MENLGELKALVRPVGEIAQNVADAYRREILEVAKLREEMGAIANSILDTRKQLASMHAGAPRSLNLDRMTGELDAVVRDTAGATNGILAAAEGIQDIALSLKNEISSKSGEAQVDQMLDLVLKVFESCNFQDLTGQRITRMVETLEFIEGRVERMMQIWGGLETIDRLIEEQQAALEEERESEGSYTLVNGPQMEGDEGHVDQNEIDALFN